MGCSQYCSASGVPSSRSACWYSSELKSFICRLFLGLSSKKKSEWISNPRGSSTGVGVGRPVTEDGSTRQLQLALAPRPKTGRSHGPKSRKRKNIITSSVVYHQLLG